MNSVTLQINKKNPAVTEDFLSHCESIFKVYIYHIPPGACHVLTPGS